MKDDRKKYKRSKRYLKPPDPTVLVPPTASPRTPSVPAPRAPVPPAPVTDKSLFISHAETDKPLVDELMRLVMVGCGVPEMKSSTPLTPTLVFRLVAQ
jgi:hypothetical protein